MTEHTTLPWEHELRVEDEGDGKFGLYINNTRVVWIGPTFANPKHRECHWEVRGPMDLDRSIAIMKGFLHLTAIVANGERAHAGQPANLENDGKSSLEKRKWQTSKTTRK